MVLTFATAFFASLTAAFVALTATFSFCGSSLGRFESVLRVARLSAFDVGCFRFGTADAVSFFVCSCRDGIGAAGAVSAARAASRRSNMGELAAWTSEVIFSSGDTV